MERIIELEKFEEIGVQWHRKSCVNDKYPFKVTWDKDSEIKTIKNIEIIRISTEEYDRIANTLDDITLHQLISKTIVVITDNNKYLAIDTQGYSYPRYKSAVWLEGQILPF